MIDKKYINNIMNSTENLPGKIYTYVIFSLIILSIVSYSISTLPDLSLNIENILKNIEFFTVIIFTIEYIMQIYIIEEKRKFIFSFYGIIDLLAILPFYIGINYDLRSIRILRLLRFIKILKLFKSTSVFKTYINAYNSIKYELLLFFIVSAAILYISAIGIYYFEYEEQPDKFKSVFHCLWWSITTLTTVGYGDMYPVTIGGKAFTFLTLVIGLGTIAVPSGLLASALKTASNEKNT